MMISLGIILEYLKRKGGYHENLVGTGCTTERRRSDSQISIWESLDVSKRSSGSTENSDGHYSRTQRSYHRSDLPVVQLQNQEVVLRRQTLRFGKRHRGVDTEKDGTKNRFEKNSRTGKKNNSIAYDNGQKHVRNHPRRQSGRVCCQVASSIPNIGRLRYHQKKNPKKEIKERSRALLTSEPVEILNGSLKPKPVEVTRLSIQTDLEALLKRGFTTTHAGGFFFIPYLMELDLYKSLDKLATPKQSGIPNEKIALQMIWESIFGYTKGIRSVDSVSQADFGALSGLPFICSVATEYRLLSQSSVERSEEFQKTMGKQLLRLGYIKGDVVNMDGHTVKLYSRKEMKASYLSKEKSYGKAIRTFYTQDQESKKPLFAKVGYSGTTVSQVTPQLVEANKDILGGPFLCVFDKEWFVGSLLDHLDKMFGIQVLLPVKRTPKRLDEMESIPFEKFKYRYGNQPIATLVTKMDGFDGKMKLFVKRNADNTFFGLISNKKYFRAVKAMDYYTRRWGIEDFFGENVFLGLDRLPSLEINAIQTALSLKMVSFNLVDNFRKNLPSPFSTMKPESIHRHFIQGVQGKVQLKKDKLQVDIYGFQHQDLVASVFRDLEGKLTSQNIDPRCSWLNNHILNFSFK